MCSIGRTPRRRAARLLTLAGALAFAGSPSIAAAIPSGPPQHIAVGCEAFTHTPNWEHVSGYRDGRYQGSSLRSFRLGARATLDFEGQAVRLFGVVGRGGGIGVVSVDGLFAYVLDFYAPQKGTHREMYTSPLLKRGRHHLTIDVVKPQGPLSRPRYVNLDGAEIVT